MAGVAVAAGRDVTAVDEDGTLLSGVEIVDAALFASDEGVWKGPTAARPVSASWPHRTVFGADENVEGAS